MGATLRYVKDFDFGPAKVQVKAYARGGAVKKSEPACACKGGMMKAKGGAVTEKATGERYPSREAMVKHEAKETPRMQREEMVQRSKIVAPARGRGVPVAPTQPLLAMKKGGAVPAKGAYKVPKVMTEFKSGELHSGSKSGPVVTNPKQAIAIALSEARKAGKK